MIYRTVFIWPAINRGLPRDGRGRVCVGKNCKSPNPLRRGGVHVLYIRARVYGFYIHTYLFFRSYMHSYFQCLSPPFVNTLLIMYTHESITGHRGLSYHHFAAFIQRFFGNNFPRRTRRRTYTYIVAYIYIFIIL